MKILLQSDLIYHLEKQFDCNLHMHIKGYDGNNLEYSIENCLIFLIVYFEITIKVHFWHLGLCYVPNLEFNFDFKIDSQKNNALRIFSCRRSQGSSRNHFSSPPRLLVQAQGLWVFSLIFWIPYGSLWFLMIPQSSLSFLMVP